MLGTRNVWDLCFVIIINTLEYLSIPNEISWIWDPLSLNIKFTCVSYIPYIHILNVISFSFLIMLWIPSMYLPWIIVNQKKKGMRLYVQSAL